MDTRAAGQYLNKLFGTAEGYVSAAYKDQDESWQECQFQWPSERAKLLGWAQVHSDANVFICPALRNGENRVKGDAQPTRWLWADVDWDKVPEDKRQVVKDRIKALGTYVVASGSGENNHVYVQLDKPVSVADHYRLNSGLKSYLYADAKHADNSLLRLPGTVNWKTKAGSRVRVQGGTSKAVPATNLLALREFKDVRVTDMSSVTGEWKPTEVEGLPRRIARMAQMPADEAVAKYGNRHKAVWAVTGELHKRGLDSDAIHTLMDSFPAAVEKNAEEHNGYDVHKDVDKRLMWDRAKAPEMDEEADEDAGDFFEELTVEEVEQALIAEGVQKELLRRSIRRAADQAEAMAGHTEPPPDTSSCLSDLLNVPPAPVQYLIDGLCSAEANVVIAGQYKAGKTKLMLASLVTALADNEPFLGVREVHVPEGGAVVGHWNLEMSALDIVDKYMRPAQFKNPHNVHVANWRGHRLNILTQEGKDYAVEWLRSRNVQVWTLDSWTALCRMCGVDPNSGMEVGRILSAIDEIKMLAGVSVLFFLAHTARASAESEKPGTRGASEVDDHVDTRWMFTVDKTDVRWLSAEGRDTQMPAVSLDFHEGTGRSTLGSTRQTAASDGWVQVIVGIVTDYPQGLAEAVLWDKMKQVRAIAKPKAVEYMVEAVDSGFIRREKGESSGRGGRAPWMHYPAVDLRGTDRAMKATPGVVDLRRTGAGPKRRLP